MATAEDGSTIIFMRSQTVRMAAKKQFGSVGVRPKDGRLIGSSLR